VSKNIFNRIIERPTIPVIVITAIIAFFALYLRKTSEDKALFRVELYSSNAIDLTPTQIRSIERIGKWEFLAIADEELVDTTRQRTLARDDRLVRIYHGTLRLGVDLSQCEEGWVLAHGDTVSLTLPPVILLSEHFIDEARTRAFYESGTWDATAKEQMYQKAARQMKRRCLTPANQRLAEDNARKQMVSLFRTFGFRNVEVRFK
jgi:hypothetical protein